MTLLAESEFPPQATETEASVAMPTFASLVDDLARTQPLAGARIACTLPPTGGASVVAESLTALGAALCWMPASIDAPRDRLQHLLHWPDGRGPNLLLEWRADISRLIHFGTRLEGRPGIEHVGARLRLPAGALPYSAIAMDVRGSAEASPRGARWFARQSAGSALFYPAMNCAAAEEVSDLTVSDQGSRQGAACALLVLAQVELFSRHDPAPTLRAPPTALMRTVSGTRDAWLRARVQKLPAASVMGSIPSRPIAQPTLPVAGAARDGAG